MKPYYIIIAVLCVAFAGALLQTFLPSLRRKMANWRVRLSNSWKIRKIDKLVSNIEKQVKELYSIQCQDDMKQVFEQQGLYQVIYDSLFVTKTNRMLSEECYKLSLAGVPCDAEALGGSIEANIRTLEERLRTVRKLVREMRLKKNEDNMP